MPKMSIDILEFYITNVCNLTCENCRSFNNYKFKGMFEFDQTKMSQWADILDIKTIGILGGEPLLHPRLPEWISGIRKLWPASEIRLVSNGTRLSKCKNLHNILADNNCILEISVHGNHLKSTVAKELFLAFGECTPHGAREVDSIADNPEFINSFIFKTSKDVLVDIRNGSSLQEICFADDNFKLWNSDPKKAHSTCSISGCHHMIDYKIYKCSVLGLLPEFFRQQNKPTDQLLPYQGLDVESVTQEAIDQLKKCTPHCSICPEGNKYQPIQSFFKKDIQKLSNKTAE